MYTIRVIYPNGESYSVESFHTLVQAQIAVRALRKEHKRLRFWIDRSLD